MCFIRSLRQVFLPKLKQNNHLQEWIELNYNSKQHFSLFSYKIKEGLRNLYNVKPAGETYMHEGIKEVSAASFQSRNRLKCHRCQTERFVVCCSPEGLSSDKGPVQQNLQYHPGSDGREAGALRARTHGEGGEMFQINLAILHIPAVCVQPVGFLLYACLFCRLMNPGNTAHVFTVWALKTLMSSR